MQSLGFRLAANTLPERTRSTNSAATKGPKGLSESLAGTGVCVQTPFRLILTASLARLENELPCPLLPKTAQGGDRVFCHSAHTRPSMRGEESPFLQEDHMLNFVFLSLTKISTAARGTRNSPKPLRRREREITTMSIASVAIED